MSSGKTNQSIPAHETLGLMEDLAEMLRAEVLPTHLPLIQLIDKICKDPALSQVDLYSKYTRLAAVVGGDWITAKEELRNASRFGAPAVYCSVSAMLAVFTCRRTRSHDDLVSSLTELYNHISAGNEILNKQVANAITTVGKQMEHANIADASIAQLSERVGVAVTTLEKQEELVKRAETSITNIIQRADHAVNAIKKQVDQANLAEASLANLNKRVDSAMNTIDKHVEKVSTTNAIQPMTSGFESPKNTEYNKDLIVLPGTTYRCKYGALTIDEKSHCTFNGSSMQAKSLGLWLSLPLPHDERTKLMNLNHEDMIRATKLNLSSIHAYKHNFNATEKDEFSDSLFSEFKYKPRQWAFIS